MESKIAHCPTCRNMLYYPDWLCLSKKYFGYCDYCRRPYTKKEVLWKISDLVIGETGLPKSSKLDKSY